MLMNRIYPPPPMLYFFIHGTVCLCQELFGVCGQSLVLPLWTGIFLGLWSPGLNKFLGSSHRQKVGRLGGLICGLMPPAKVGRMGGLSCYFSRGLILWPPPGDQAMSAYPLSITSKIVDFCYAQILFGPKKQCCHVCSLVVQKPQGRAPGPFFIFRNGAFLVSFGGPQFVQMASNQELHTHS